MTTGNRCGNSSGPSATSSPHNTSMRKGEEGADYDIAGAQLLVVLLNGGHGSPKCKSECNEARTKQPGGR
jgi:hypothetical protein